MSEGRGVRSERGAVRPPNPQLAARSRFTQSEVDFTGGVRDRSAMQMLGWIGSHAGRITE